MEGNQRKGEQRKRRFRLIDLVDIDSDSDGECFACKKKVGDGELVRCQGCRKLYCSCTSFSDGVCELCWVFLLLEGSC